MTISQGLVKVVFGSKENGATHFVWHRISRRKWSSLERYYGSLSNFYYAKVYSYKRLGKRKGYPIEQIGYIHWDKDGILTTTIF
ncbi:hypothetical protein D2U88_16145 [Flagellimonas aequoris]|uniref:Uncharacterized protein n=1 Tax=Flagellimonas aequoris TaxID=2306997 RepID=A0A418N4M5_9FLAO|nr:hypothetical protein D2U88_16145 [Allomuricauda aequoris]